MARQMRRQAAKVAAVGTTPKAPEKGRPKTAAKAPAKPVPKVVVAQIDTGWIGSVENAKGKVVKTYGPYKTKGAAKGAASGWMFKHWKEIE